MKLFDPQRSSASAQHMRIYGRYEKIYTSIDVVAAVMFVIGSALFFDEDRATLATWFFLIGSICFAARPCVRFMREFHLARLPLPEDD